MDEPVQLSGTWYPVGGSASYQVHLCLENAGYRLFGEQVRERSGSIAELRDPGRIGRVARRLEWPDGSLLELDEDTGLDAHLKADRRRSPLTAALHRAERGPRWIVLAAVSTLAIAALMYLYGLPALARAGVERLPVTAFERLSAGAMDSLDDAWLSPSQLPADEQQRILARFRTMTEALVDDGFEYRLHLRRMGSAPNAFALPNGEIVLTDGLVELATTPAQIDAVLLHEIGHVRRRHGVATLLQSRVVELVATLATGSSSGLAELGAAVASQALSSNYSRRAEADADAFAFEALAQRDQDPAAFAEIITALGSGGGSPVPGWLASHPGTDQRAEAARRASRAWRDARP